MKHPIAINFNIVLVFLVQPLADISNSHRHLLESDDTLFLNVSFDNGNSSIGDSTSPFESPEINLNSARIAPSSLKRKSTEGDVTTCKKRLLDDVSFFGESSVTDSEFLQIQTGQVNSKETSQCYNEAFSQRYFSKQFTQAKAIADDTRNKSQMDLNSSNVAKLNLTQIFNDDFEDEINDMVLPCNQSQIFLETVKSIGQLPRHPSQKLEELDGTTYKSKNASMYIQLQRSMQAGMENETNVIDDDFVDPELSQAMKSTQYRREVEDDFAKCEETICNLGNLNDSGHSVDMNVALNMSADHPHRLNDINWNSPMIPMRTPPSSLIKNRLAMFSKSRESVHTTPKSITSNNFSPMGPYFGLPISVKSLIKEYKGIDELYGK